MDYKLIKPRNTHLISSWLMHTLEDSLKFMNLLPKSEALSMVPSTWSWLVSKLCWLKSASEFSFARLVFQSKEYKGKYTAALFCQKPTFNDPRVQLRVVQMTLKLKLNSGKTISATT